MPKIVSRDQWLAERKELLAHEKELTKHHDHVNAKRRRLPMVKIEKNYVFDGPNGKPSLKELFDCLSLHVRPGVGQRLFGLHGFCRRPGRSVAAEQTRHDIRGRFSRPAGQAPSVQSTKGMEHLVAFVFRERFQLRFSCDARPEGRTR